MFQMSLLSKLGRALTIVLLNVSIFQSDMMTPSKYDDPYRTCSVVSQLQNKQAAL